MRYRELTEDFATEQTLINYAGTIRQNCQPYLKQNPSAIIRHTLYRGVKMRGPKFADIIRKEVRLKNRKPSDMPLFLHKFINGYFKKEYGSSFRSSMFAGGSLMSAQDYGPAYVIFPIDNFKYLWSPKFEDLYSITSEYGFDDLSPFEEHKGPVFTKEITDSLIDEVLSTYQTSNLTQAIDSGHEIMIRCKAYYGILADVVSEAQDEINKILYK